MRAVLRHEGAVHTDILGTGGLQTHHMPGVDNFVIGFWNQEGAVVAHIKGRPLFWHHGAEEDPVAVLATAGEAPLAAQLVATVNLFNFTDWRIGGGNQGRGIILPHILCGLIVKQCKLPVVHSNNTQYPGAGHTGLGDLHLHRVKHLRVEGITAPLLGLQHLEEAGGLKISDGFIGNTAQFGGFCTAFAQCRLHVFSTLQQRLCQFGIQTFVNVYANTTVHRLYSQYDLKAKILADWRAATIVQMGHIRLGIQARKEEIVPTGQELRDFPAQPGPPRRF